MSNVNLLAQYLREGEASYRSESAMLDPFGDASSDARYAELIFDVADYLETLSDDDPRIIQMERADYFVDGIDGAAVPGDAGELYIQEIRTEAQVGGPGGFIDALAQAAVEDMKR